MFDRNRRDISAYEEQRALLIAWPYNTDTVLQKLFDKKN